MPSSNLVADMRVSQRDYELNAKMRYIERPRKRKIKCSGSGGYLVPTTNCHVDGGGAN
jgi:hypothetical protein